MEPKNLLERLERMIHIAHETNCVLTKIATPDAEKILELLKAQEPMVMTLSQVVSAEIGTVVWLECYFDGRTSIEAFLVDMDASQKPVLINGRDMFFNVYEDELNNQIIDKFDKSYEAKKYRFWSFLPTDEQRKAVKWDE